VQRAVLHALSALVASHAPAPARSCGAAARCRGALADSDLPYQPGTPASAVRMLLQEPHDVRFSWIELEPFGLRIDFPRRVALLDFSATELGRDARLRPLADPTLMFGVAVASAIDGHGALGPMLAAYCGMGGKYSMPRLSA
jgi:hypothetical protein